MALTLQHRSSMLSSISLNYDSVLEMRLDEVYQHITKMKRTKQDEGPLFSDVQDENFIPLKLMFKESPNMRGLPLAKLLSVSVLL